MSCYWNVWYPAIWDFWKEIWHYSVQDITHHYPLFCIFCFTLGFLTLQLAVSYHTVWCFVNTRIVVRKCDVPFGPENVNSKFPEQNIHHLNPRKFLFSPVKHTLPCFFSHSLSYTHPVSYTHTHSLSLTHTLSLPQTLSFISSLCYHAAQPLIAPYKFAWPLLSV